MEQLTLVLGGARSGKSTFAEQLARDTSRNSVLYVATAQALDNEMAERIEKHRRSRPPAWRTAEVPTAVGEWLKADRVAERVILLDCLTLLISNIATIDEALESEVIEARVVAEVQELIEAARQLRCTLIVVSNEVGMGLVPPYPLGRVYRDVLGRANQMLAAAADEVYLLVAGIPMAVKGG
ncbi:MAG: bifunctional adenosylcobinamide kinase/adenosylcobinamide-phosphate guanylyltransferase [Chloroflexi bacterium]|nr:bifunctional adenosylcobinamide kinase/adenosylcobinamide-phosphate guanylyltransferase [Chloroflexota bacterium]